MNAYTTSGTVKEGTLKIANVPAFKSALGVFEGFPVHITIEKARAARSVRQNRFYWGVVIAMVADYTGYSAEETHEALKTLFLPKKVAMLDGNGDVVNELVIGGSTTVLKTIEFEDYMERIREFAREKFGIEIPLPNEEAA